MSNYWQKKLKELEKDNSSSTKKATTGYWQQKLNELEEENKKKTTVTYPTSHPVLTPASIKTKNDEEEEEEKKGIFDGWFKSSDSDSVSKTILGSGADLLSDIGTGIIGMGEKALDALATIAPYAANANFYQNGVFDLETEKAHREAVEQSKKDIGEWVAKDLYDEEAVAKQLLSNLGSSSVMTQKLQNGGYATQEDWDMYNRMQGESSKYLNEDMEAHSVFDTKTDSLAQSAGQLAGTAALSAMGIPADVVIGLTSYGSEFENAMKEGATYDEAAFSSAVSAGAEILTEKISGGIKFGGKTLDEFGTKWLARNVSNKALRTAGNTIMQMAGEGGEEVLSGFFGAIGQKLSYMDEKELSELFTKEDAWESLIGGAVLGLGGNVVQTANSAANGVDAVTGLTKNEQKVVDKVFKDELAKEKGTVTEKQKSKIYDRVLRYMEKGYISTDTIEEVLGGETYDRYKKADEWEKSLQSEYDELHKMKRGDMTGEQIDREAALKKQLDNVKATSTLDQMKAQLSDEVANMTKGDRLTESYNESARTKQKFEADLTQYDKKYHATYQRAIESGVLNNTNRSHELVDLAAKLEADKGYTIDFTNNKKIKETGFAVEGKIVNGYKTDSGIAINVQSPKYLESTVGHEITHVLEGTDFYNELQETIFKYAESKGEYKSRLEALTKLYEGRDADIKAELTADLVGDYIFSDTDFVNKLSTEHREWYEKIFDEIKYFCKIVTAGSEEARQLEKVKKVFEDAWRADVKETGKSQHSLSAEEDERVFYTPRGVEVVKNPTNAEYRQMREEIYKEYPWLRGTGEAILRHTYDEDGNEYYWNASNGMHRDVEPYINKQYNTRTSQQWEWWKREDKDDYPTDYSDIRYSLSEDTGSENNTYAPTFYSQMGKVIDGVKQEKLGAASVVHMLRGKGVKAEEIKWSGIEEWLEGKKSVTKTELQEFVKGSMLQIVEQELTDSVKYSESQQARLQEINFENESAWDELFDIWDKLYPNYAFPFDIIASDHPSYHVRRSLETTGKDDSEDGKRMLQLSKIIEQNLSEGEDISISAAKPETRWGDYKMGGGSNYREILFRLPDSYYTNDAMEAHWEDAGILAHARVQDFDTPNGKMLFIEEIQSDWHNEGHKSGYASGNTAEITSLKDDIETALSVVRDTYTAMKQAEGELHGLVFDPSAMADPQFEERIISARQKYNSARLASEKARDEYRALREKFEKINGNVPDAPFKNNYHEFVLKSLIRKAAEQGYDSIGWTTAQIQDERWENSFFSDLSVEGKGKSGFLEGYTIEYDQDIPKFLTKYGKKWGAKVGKTNIGASSFDIEAETEAPADMDDDMWLLREEMHFEDEGTEVWSMPITPAMKQSVLYEGQPMYSLSEKGDTPYGRGTLGKDVAYVDPNATVEQETQLTEENSTDILPDNLPPAQSELESLYQEKEDLEIQMAEMGNTGDLTNFDSVNERYLSVMDRIEVLETEESSRVDSLAGEEAPPEVETQPDIAPAKFVSPFENRDYFSVGRRTTNAFMHDNPEFADLFKAEANIMLGELQRTTKGKKLYNDVLFYESRGEEGWTGQKRTTSDSIAELIDSYGMSYEQIQKGLEAIIQGGGAENIADAKHIEFMIDDRLKNGYTAYPSTEVVPPNQEYIDLSNAWVASQTAQKAADSLTQTDDYVPLADRIQAEYDAKKKGIEAPLTESGVAEPDEQPDISPYRIASESEVSKPDSTSVAEHTKSRILPSKKTPKGKKFSAWEWAKEHILDNGMVFEDLSKETGNRALEELWDFIRKSRARAQHLIGKGNGQVKALKDIRKAVQKSGKYHEFEDYMYHKHNISRMNLEARGFGYNKSVFSDAITSQDSIERARKYEAENPEFVDWAQDVYDYMGHLRSLLVESGVISQETSDLWEEMYPHYVPIRRDGFSGLNINVPLDTRKTGFNTPVKRAKGGNQKILDMFDTIGERTTQTFRAISKNNFGIELKNTLGRTIQHEFATLDDLFANLESEESILKKGDKDQPPTFTVFENGQRVEFEITEEMYEALKPRSAAMQYRAPIVSTWSKLFRNLTTEYNPSFVLTNPIKDVQDVLLNSQHPVRTNLNLPVSIWQQVSNGKWYQEYLENGGENNSFFDNETSTFDDGLSRWNLIAQLNNHIEMTPRLAEYIVSRKSGKGIEAAMLDAARVTTNFSAGGDVAKFVNANGATFLNASIQGAVQQARNIREAHHNGWKGYAGLLARTAMAGLPAVLLNAMWDDDEDYQNLADYAKQNYYIVHKTEDGRFIRIPKGRAVAVIQDVVDKVMTVSTGDDELDLRTFLELAADNLMLAAENVAPNNPLDNNIVAPLFQVARNKTWYDEDIVSSSLQKLPKTEQFDEKTDSLSIKIGQATKTSPKKWNYLLNQYSGGIGDIILPMYTPKAESGDDSRLGQFLAPIRDKFTTDPVLNSQIVTDFREKQDELTVASNASTATEEDKMRSIYMDTISFELNDLYAQKREIQLSDKPDSEKYALTRELQQQINDAMEDALSSYNDVHIDGKYSEVGNRRFNYDSGKDSWYQIKEKNADGSDNYYYQQERKAVKLFGAKPADYWNNREDYDDAMYYATSYGKDLIGTVKNVFGVSSFAKYGRDLSELKADYGKNGKAISGSKKNKVIDYCNDMDADYGEKIILFKSQYPSDDTYNEDIIEYLKERDDIPYKEKVTILKELGFKVFANGNISWD